MFSNRDFAWAREIIQTSLTWDSGKFVHFNQTSGPLVSFSYYLVLVLCSFNKILKPLIFSGEIVTSLGNNFSMQKSLLRNIFGPYIFVCKPIFKIFAAHFRTKGILNNDKIIFEWGCFTAWWYAKNLLKDVAYGVGPKLLPVWDTSRLSPAPGHQQAEHGFLSHMWSSNSCRCSGERPRLFFLFSDTPNTSWSEY